MELFSSPLNLSLQPQGKLLAIFNKYADKLVMSKDPEQKTQGAFLKENLQSGKCNGFSTLFSHYMTHGQIHLLKEMMDIIVDSDKSSFDPVQLPFHYKNLAQSIVNLVDSHNRETSSNTAYRNEFENTAATKEIKSVLEETFNREFWKINQGVSTNTVEDKASGSHIKSFDIETFSNNLASRLIEVLKGDQEHLQKNSQNLKKISSLLKRYLLTQIFESFLGQLLYLQDHKFSLKGQNQWQPSLQDLSESRQAIDQEPFGHSWYWTEDSLAHFLKKIVKGCNTETLIQLSSCDHVTSLHFNKETGTLTFWDPNIKGCSQHNLNDKNCFLEISKAILRSTLVEKPLTMNAVPAILSFDFFNAENQILKENLESFNNPSEIKKVLGKKDRGYNVLALATIFNHKTIVKDLITAGENLDEKIGSNQTTPLLLALDYGHGEIFHELIQGGASVFLRDKNNKNAHQYARKWKDKDFYQVLKEHEKQVKDFIWQAQQGNIIKNQVAPYNNIDIQDKDGDTALILAGVSGRINVVKALLEEGANINIVNDDQRSALMEVAQGGHRDCAEVLLKNGANANQKDKDGYTALILAAENGHYDIVMALLDAGAMVNTTNNNSQTAYDLATNNNHNLIANLLQIECENEEIYMNLARARVPNSAGMTLQEKKIAGKLLFDACVEVGRTYQENASDNQAYEVYMEKERENNQYRNIASYFFLLLKTLIRFLGFSDRTTVRVVPPQYDNRANRQEVKSSEEESNGSVRVEPERVEPERVEPEKVEPERDEPDNSDKSRLPKP